MPKDEDDEFKDLLSGLNFDIGNIGFEEDEEGEQMQALFRSDADEYDYDTKYLKPKRRECKTADFVCYDNAVALAKQLKLKEGERCDAMVGGNFIFGDFIEAYLTTYNVTCVDMKIATLSLSQENIDSLANLISHGYIDKLSMFVSVYFYAHERSVLIPYIYSKLDTSECDFQLTITDIHCKIAQFKTLGGKSIVCHGSANLRRSGNIEQITLEENKPLYDFYAQYLNKVEEEYKTIKKGIRGKQAWQIMTKNNEPPTPKT